jgi:hypothetical protein
VIVDSAGVLGSDVVNGKECWQLECRNQSSLRQIRYWLDQATLECLKGECNDTKGARLRWKHSDFREIAGGVSLPYRTETYVAGTLTSTTEIRKLEVNVELKETLFQLDAVKFKRARGANRPGRD